MTIENPKSPLEAASVSRTETAEQQVSPLEALKGEVGEKIKGLEKTNPEYFQAAQGEIQNLENYSQKEREMMENFTRGDKELANQVADAGDLYRWTEFSRKLEGKTGEDLKNDPELISLKGEYNRLHDSAQEQYMSANEGEAEEKRLAQEKGLDRNIEFVPMSDIESDIKELEGYLDLFKRDPEKMKAIQDSINEARKLGGKRDQYDRARQEAVHNNQPESSIENIAIVRDEWARRYEEVLDSVRDDINDALWERDRRGEERTARRMSNIHRESNIPMM